MTSNFCTKVEVSHKFPQMQQTCFTSETGKGFLSSVTRNREALKEDVRVSLGHRMRCRWTWHGPSTLLTIAVKICENVTGALKPPDTSVVSFTFGPGSQVKHCRDISGLCSCISSFYFQVPISLNICTLRIPDT